MPHMATSIRFWTPHPRLRIVATRKRSCVRFMRDTSSLQRLLKALLLCTLFPLQLQAADSVAVENAKPGTSAWQLANPASMYGSSLNASDYANAEIQGYASRTSVNQGESIDF